MLGFIIAFVLSGSPLPKVEVMTFPEQIIVVCNPECQADQAIEIVRRQVQRMDYR